MYLCFKMCVNYKLLPLLLQNIKIKHDGKNGKTNVQNFQFNRRI